MTAPSSRARQDKSFPSRVLRKALFLLFAHAQEKTEKHWSRARVRLSILRIERERTASRHVCDGDGAVKLAPILHPRT